jgi:hemolysin III
MKYAPTDSGPIYAETLWYQTNTQNFLGIVEPFNAWSNLLFLALILYWGYHCWRQNWRPRLIVFCLPFLLIGFVGGFLYHGYRNLDLWYHMDVIPIMLLTYMVTVYFWSLVDRVLLGLILMLAIQTGGLFLSWYFDFNSALGSLFFYIPLAGNILLSVTASFVKGKIYSVSNLVLASVLISFALFFRFIDIWAMRFFPQGTHFLWHVGGALSVHFLVRLIWYNEFYCLERLSSADSSAHCSAKVNNFNQARSDPIFRPGANQITL